MKVLVKLTGCNFDVACCKTKLFNSFFFSEIYNFFS